MCRVTAHYRVGIRAGEHVPRRGVGEAGGGCEARAPEVVAGTYPLLVNQVIVAKTLQARRHRDAINSQSPLKIDWNNGGSKSLLGQRAEGWNTCSTSGTL